MKIEFNIKEEDPVNDASRYVRQMKLEEIGFEGQKKLNQAKVLVIGAGGIGSSVLMYLSAMGIGQIGIVDDDKGKQINFLKIKWINPISIARLFTLPIL